MDTPKHFTVAGYPHFEKEFVGAVGPLNTFGGKPIGTAKIVSRWQTPHSYVFGYQHQVEATVDGHTYTGRCAGSGMIFKGKLKRTK